MKYGKNIIWAGVCAAMLAANPAKAQDAQGEFEASWQSLEQYQTPEWFKDAKLGLWAHWGPQCVPMDGDWYARNMYWEGSDQYKYHVAHYGDPKDFGFKDVIREWKAENWTPEKLVKLYKDCGAEYFVAMANHHDNLDMWNSTYQEWNTVTWAPIRISWRDGAAPPRSADYPSASASMPPMPGHGMRTRRSSTAT
jgi:alpha-L-fucosidase